MTDTNQASEDEQIDDVLTNAIDYYISGNGVQPEAISRIKSLIRTEKLKAKTSEVRLMRSEAREAWDNGTVTSDFYERIKVYTDSRLDELKLEAEL